MIHNSKHGEIYYKLIGPKNAPILVFNHGLMMDHKTFSEQINYFSVNYRILVWDLPGHGSSFRLEGKFNFSLAAECLKDLLDEVSVDKAVLAGLSLGGQINQYFAYLYPEKVLALVHVGSVPLHRKIRSSIYFPLRFFLELCHLVPEESRIARFLVRSVVRTMALEDSTRAYLERSVFLVGKKNFINITREVLKESSKTAHPVVRVPSLIIHGKKDSFIIGRMARNWHKEIPEFDYKVISSAGHIANLDNPLHFNKILESFLKRLNYC